MVYVLYYIDILRVDFGGKNGLEGSSENIIYRLKNPEGEAPSDWIEETWLRDFSIYELFFHWIHIPRRILLFNFHILIKYKNSGAAEPNAQGCAANI